jgi:hypothetical protein
MQDESSVEIAQCPHCSAAIMADHRFNRCQKCGKKLPPEIVALVDDYKTGLRTVSSSPAPSEAASTSVSMSAVSSHTGSMHISSLMRRYRDAYLVSTVTNGFGALIKGLGLVIGGLVVIVGLFLLGQGRAGDAAFAFGLIVVAIGVISALAFYIFGVLLSANAQVLKATLDGAVNTSPFLTNEHRAKIMSL